MNAHTETIAAIASASGSAGVGVVRISGPQVPTMACHFIGHMPRERHAYLTRFGDAGGETIDQGLLLYFPAPASYTGEHVLELQAHGSPVLLDLLLRRVCQMGARLARPGEFTERAFLNGKLDLTQAEAVADLIAARSQVAARAALQSLEGVFARKLDSLLQKLINVRVQIEAVIDFPEDDVNVLADSMLTTALEKLRDEHAKLLSQSQHAVHLNDAFKVVIAGRPNAGKSSLLNTLTGRDCAIVTATPGTTRDVLRESLNLDGVTLNLVDTAGLRDSDDDIELEGISRARFEIEQADLVLWVTDSRYESASGSWCEDLPSAVERVVLVNKIDLHHMSPQEQIQEGVYWFWVCAKTGEGLTQLRQHLRQRIDNHFGEGGFSARRRHVLALQNVGQHIRQAACLLNICASELAAEELRVAQHALGEITGRYSSDDLLGAIFSSFCIGK